MFLSPEIQRKIDALRGRSRGARTAEERAHFRQRMAEIQTNLAIEAMPLTPDELTFFELVFEINAPPEAQRDLLRSWTTENARRAAAHQLTPAE